MDILKKFKNCKMAVKLDPDKTLPGEAVDAITRYPPGVIIIGGTQRITPENTRRLLEEIRNIGYNSVIIHEVSEITTVMENVDGYIIPVVLNAGDYKWITGLHLEAVKNYREMINWNKIITAGYVICNTESAAGKLTKALPIDRETVSACALLAGELLGISVLYIEYSGILGDFSLVQAASRECEGLHVVYGGGIKDVYHARKMQEAAATIVIGNVAYEDPVNFEEILRYMQNNS